MRFMNSLNMSGACFVPRIKKYEVQDCATNADTSQVRIRYYGNFYDTDAADDGGNDGIVNAGIGMRRYGNSTDKKGEFVVSAWVEECEGFDCNDLAWNTWDGIDDPDLYFDTVKAKNNKKALCIGYDRANHEFVFSFGDDVKTVNAADHGLPAPDSNITADWTWHVIETRIDVENCSAGAISGFIDADFDNVMIRSNNDLLPPTRTITIDGTTDDWNGISPTISDPQNDSLCEVGTDVKSLYLAKDDNYLYWRVDTHSGGFTFGSPGDERMLNLLIYEADSPGGPYPNGITVVLGNPDSGYVSARYDNQNWTGLYGGGEYGKVNDVAEGRIPIDEFDPFLIEFVSAYYWRDGEPKCDWASKGGLLNLD